MSVTATPTATDVSAAVPTLNDRCDRCGAPAYVYVRLGSGGELQFCGHHGRQYLPELRKLAVAIHDRTETLTR